METTTKKRGFHKKAATAVAAVTVAAIMITGTFAWYAYAHAENVFFGRKTQPDLPKSVLHDDFDMESGQKEVYVENIGESAIYVRVKLNELMDLDTHVKDEAVESRDFIPHTPKGVWRDYHHEDCGHLNGEDDDDDDTIRKFHDLFTLKWGTEWTDTPSGMVEEKFQKWYLPATKMTGKYAGYNKGTYVADTTNYETLTTEEKEALGLKQTQLGSIVSIDHYLDGMSAAEKIAYIGWIYDLDGWAYWSQPLKGGDATGLLLTAVEKDEEALSYYDYCYIIDVIMDAVDADDLDMWLIEGKESVDPLITDIAEQAGENGRKALEIIRNIPVQTTP